MSRPREPLREVVLLVVLLIVGMVGFVLMRQRDATSDTASAIATARGFLVRGASLDAIIAYDNPGAEVTWAMVTIDANLVRVAARAARDHTTTEYRFDVDLRSGRVHPANPQARELVDAPAQPF